MMIESRKGVGCKFDTRLWLQRGWLPSPPPPCLPTTWGQWSLSPLVRTEVSHIPTGCWVVFLCSVCCVICVRRVVFLLCVVWRVAFLLQSAVSSVLWALTSHAMPLSHLVRRTQVGFCGKIITSLKLTRMFIGHHLHFSKLNSPTLADCHYQLLHAHAPSGRSCTMHPPHLDLDREEIAILGEEHQLKCSHSAKFNNIH